MLTNAAAKAAGAKSRAYKLHDQGGMHLLVRPTGTKSWQLKYRVRGREKLLTLGAFPDVNVSRARILQAEAKELLEQGIDPSKKRATGKTLEALGRAWFEKHCREWSLAHAADVLSTLERDIFPELGARPAGEVVSRELLEAVRRIENRGCATTAQRVRQRLEQIFAFGRAEGLVDNNPASDLGAAMLSAPPAQPFPALTRIEDCRALLQACEADRGRAITIMASRFLALTAVRLGTLRGARWEEIDFDAASWAIPAARMKLSKAKKNDSRFDHVVPLSEPALFVLRGLRAARPKSVIAPDLIFTGRSTSSSIGAGAIGALYDRCGYRGRHVPHGWRASFSTILNEEMGEDYRFAIDAALGHSGKGKVEAAYNRAQLLDRRREVFELWGSLLAG